MAPDVLLALDRSRHPMTCNRCADLIRRRNIRSQADLAHVLEAVHAALADGTLTGHSHRSIPALTLADFPSAAGPWPGFIERYFRCVHCGQRFQLAVETDNRMAGAWKTFTFLDLAIEEAILLLGRPVAALLRVRDGRSGRR
jgi:hypothetical protein